MKSGRRRGEDLARHSIFVVHCSGGGVTGGQASLTAVVPTTDFFIYFGFVGRTLAVLTSGMRWQLVLAS